MVTLKRFKYVVLPLLIVGMSFGVFQYLKATKPVMEPSEVVERAWPVDVQRLQSGTYTPLVRLFGRVETSGLNTWVAPLTAELVELNVKQGDAFQKGERLLSLNAEEVAFSVDQARADLSEIQSALDAERKAQPIERQRLEQEQKLLANRQADLKRSEELVQRNLASESSVEQARDALARQELAVLASSLIVQQQPTKLAQLQARYDRAQVNLQKAMLSAERASLIAPFDGRVMVLNASQGDQVSAQAKILSFYSLKSLEVRASIPLSVREQVERALSTGQVLQAELVFSGQSYALPLTRLAAETKRSGVEGYFDLNSFVQFARPGDLFELNLHLPILQGVFAVPLSALYGSHKVYVIDNKRLKMREVEVLGEAIVDGKTWALVRGQLLEGERLVTTHLPNAMSGLLVQAPAISEQRGQ
jgi:multidrug efflux pump subunit AcrA (membrane-fusion protein)